MFTTPLFAQEALTLETAVAIALENNLNIKVAKSQAEVSVNNATKGNAGLLPSLNASGGVNYSEHNEDEIYSSGALNFSYTLFNIPSLASLSSWKSDNITIISPVDAVRMIRFLRKPC